MTLEDRIRQRARDLKSQVEHRRNQEEVERAITERIEKERMELEHLLYLHELESKP